MEEHKDIEAFAPEYIKQTYINLISGNTVQELSFCYDFLEGVVGKYPLTHKNKLEIITKAMVMRFTHLKCIKLKNL